MKTAHRISRKSKERQLRADWAAAVSEGRVVRYGDPLDTVVSFTAYSTRAEAERACADAADPKVTLVKADVAS